MSHYRRKVHVEGCTAAPSVFPKVTLASKTMDDINGRKNIAWLIVDALRCRSGWLVQVLYLVSKQQQPAAKSELDARVALSTHRG